MTTCGHCGSAFGAESWHALELVERVEPTRVRQQVTSWPDGASIEVRRCGCGHTLARKVDLESGVTAA
jgi:hypothetical protein